MINYSMLRHAVILARPKPEPIVVHRSKGPRIDNTYGDYSNCHKAMCAYAGLRNYDRGDFRIIRQEDGRYRFEAVWPAVDRSGSDTSPQREDQPTRAP